MEFWAALVLLAALSFGPDQTLQKGDKSSLRVIAGLICWGIFFFFFN